MKQILFAAWASTRPWWTYTPSKFSFSIAWWNTRVASAALILGWVLVLVIHGWFIDAKHIATSGIHEWSSFSHAMCNSWLSPVLGVVFGWVVASWVVHLFLIEFLPHREKRRLYLEEKGDDAMARATFKRANPAWPFYIGLSLGIVIACAFVWVSIFNPQKFVNNAYEWVMLICFLGMLFLFFCGVVALLNFAYDKSSKWVDSLKKRTENRFNELPHVIKEAARVRANTLGVSPDDASFMKAAIAGYEADKVRAHTQAAALLDATITASGEPSKRRL